MRAAQKILISAYIEKDELFEIERNKFIPIYYLFRTGNFTQEGVNFHIRLNLLFPIFKILSFIYFFNLF